MSEPINQFLQSTNPSNQPIHKGYFESSVLFHSLTFASMIKCSTVLVFGSTLLRLAVAFQTTSPFLGAGANANTGLYTNHGVVSSSVHPSNHLRSESQLSLFKRLRKNKTKSTAEEVTYEVTSAKELDDYFDDKEQRFRKKNGDIDYDTMLAKLSVKGDTQILGSPSHPDFVHPVLQLLHDRRRNNSPLTKTTEVRPDGKKVALVVEGGGMRGCVTAGMVTAIYYLGLEDTFDVIYGSSAGTIIGAYFNTRQLPWFGPEIYYDSLTTSGKKFIDSKRLLRTLGLGLLDPRLLKDVVTRPRFGKPVLNLDFLLKETVQEKKPLDWEKFLRCKRFNRLKLSLVV